MSNKFAKTGKKVGNYNISGETYLRLSNQYGVDLVDEVIYLCSVKQFLNSSRMYHCLTRMIKNKHRRREQILKNIKMMEAQNVRI